MRTRRKTIKEILGATIIDQHIIDLNELPSDDSFNSDTEDQLDLKDKPRKKTQSIIPKKTGVI